MKIISLIMATLMVLSYYTISPASDKVKGLKDKPEPSPPAFHTDQKESLRGIKEIAVLVDPLSPEIQKAGITAEKIKEEIETRLGQAGIRVYTENEAEGPSSKIPARPYLYINNHSYTLQKDLTYGYALNIFFIQPVQLKRNPKISCLATTWYSGGVGIIRVHKLKNFNQSELAEHIEKFIDDFLAVNRR